MVIAVVIMRHLQAMSVTPEFFMAAFFPLFSCYKVYFLSLVALEVNVSFIFL